MAPAFLEDLNPQFLILAARLDAEEFRSFLGPMNRARIYENLCNYDLLVHPSRYEGFGLTVLEGIAAGLPALASKKNVEEYLARLNSNFVKKRTPAGWLFLADFGLNIIKGGKRPPPFI
ncbi:MAG: glycosyltransferase [Actinomycetota bacterium]|nr:glycosyltransferase [Actinomycetota bacterium]